MTQDEATAQSVVTGRSERMMEIMSHCVALS